MKRASEWDDGIMERSREHFRNRTEQQNNATRDVINRIKLERDLEKLNIEDRNQNTEAGRGGIDHRSQGRQ